MKKMMALLAAPLAMAATPAWADGGLTFLINGDTFDQPFTISNTSTAGELVTAFGITLKSPYGFDTRANSAGGTFGFDGAQAFLPTAASVLATGYTGPTSVAEGANSLAFTFTNFTVGKSFVWDIDVDSNTVATVFGSDLIGSTGYADFSNGQRGLGTFTALGQRGSQFTITTFTAIPGVPEPATWGLMILGFGSTAAMLRRGRKVHAKVRYA